MVKLVNSSPTTCAMSIANATALIINTGKAGIVVSTKQCYPRNAFCIMTKVYATKETTVKATSLKQ